jgi:D-alanyl-D-alanine carboxypeptidase (penicillin-binding protein 5/6)
MLAGYGIVVSAKRAEQRLILVLNGLRYPAIQELTDFPNIRRAEEATRVMELAFREFRSYPVLKTNQIAGNAAGSRRRAGERAGHRRQAH